MHSPLIIHFGFKHSYTSALSKCAKIQLTGLFVLLALFSNFFFSCKSTQDFANYQSTVSTTLPHMKEKTRSKSVNSKKDELLTLVEISSYNSLKKVVDTVLSLPSSLKNNDKLYLYLATNLLSLLYPYTKEKFAVPQYPKSDAKTTANNYVSCFEALSKDKYPYESAKDDFLSVILPTLFIIKNEIPPLYKNDILKRIEKAKRLNTSSPLPHYLAGLFYEKEHLTYRAKEAYRKAILASESFYPAIIKYAKLCNSLHSFDEAIEMLHLLPKDYREADEVRLLTAFAHIGKKDNSAASPYLQSIFSEKVEEGEALFERVRLLIERREYMKANSLLNIYTTKNKTDKNYLLLKMRIAREWNKNEKTAKQYAEQAYTYYPQDFDVLVDCADLLLDATDGMGEAKIKGEDASMFIETVQKIEKDNIKTLKLLLKQALKEESWQVAIQTAKTLVSKNASDKNKSLLLKAYLGAKQYTDALPIASELYERSGVANLSNEGFNDSFTEGANEVFFDYLEALYKAGQTLKLKVLIASHIDGAKGDMRSVLYYYSALLQGKKGNNYLKFMRASLMANPRNSEALFAMYTFYFESKDYRNAQFYLKQAISIDGKRNKRYRQLYEELSSLLSQ